MLLLDECVPRPIAEALTTLGVASIHVTDRLKAGADDFQVLELAQSEDAILVTLDLDFTTRKAWFLDMAARGVSVVVLRPPKGGAQMDQLAEIILWHQRSWPGICAAGPVVISVKRPSQSARRLARIDFQKVEPTKPAAPEAGPGPSSSSPTSNFRKSRR